MQVIVCGHGKFSSGLASSMQLIAGENKQIHYIDFDDADDGTLLRERLILSIGSTPTLIMTDLYGGTPFRQAAMIAIQSNDVNVIAGTNLGMLLELNFKLSNASSFDELLDGLIEAGKDNIVLLDKELVSK